MEPVLLKKAPIVEALLDVRVLAPPDVTTDTLRGLRDRLGAEYPDMQPRYRVTQPIDLNPDAPLAPGTREVDGYVFTAADRRRVIQVQRDGFTFSVLAPYLGWDELRGEARRWWHHYVALAKPVRATRIGARSLNRIPIPLPAKLEEYLLTYPELASALPQGLADFMMRLVIPLERGMGIITQLVEHPMTTP